MNDMLKRCEAIAPNLTKISPNTVADLIERIDTAESSDHADNWQAMLSAAEQTAKSSMATMHDVGEVNATRADHLRIVDRPFASEETDAAQRQADGYTTMSAATIVRKRSKRGAYVEVKRHGRSLVSGDTYPQDVEASPVPASVVEHALEQYKRGEWFDGIGVARVATIAYDLPALIGGEFTSYSEVIPAEVSAGLTDYCYSAWTTGAYDGNTRHTYRRVKFPTRVGLPALRLRKGESAERVRDGVTELLAPASDREHCYIGGKRYLRPSTVHGKRTARTYGETFKLDERDPLASIVDIVPMVKPGQAVRWHVPNGHRGTITVSPKGRLSATVTGENVRVQGARSASALVAGLAPAFN